MSTLSEFVADNPGLSPKDVDRLHSLLGDWQIVADLASSDLVLWEPDASGRFIAIAHARPSGTATVFYRDIVGQPIRRRWEPLVRASFEDGRIRDTTAPDWYEQSVARLRVIPIRRLKEGPNGHRRTGAPIGVMTRHENLSEARTPTRVELAMASCANDLCAMLTAGEFPDPDEAEVPRRGAPRVSDGLIRVDEVGKVLFASPNAMSAFARLGAARELEGLNLYEVARSVAVPESAADPALESVSRAKKPWILDLLGRGMTVTLRSIPLRRDGVRFGGLVMCRDVTEFRRQAQELLTKDATIREIHHRVKNNLQTVSSLLRIQARRSPTQETREALFQAMQRVEAIAVVHATLAEGLSQTVDFDEVFARLLQLVAAVTTDESTRVTTVRTGSFGVLPGKKATPLSLVLTELVTNAIDHGLAGRAGTVLVNAHRSGSTLFVTVSDDGAGMPGGVIGDGLGTQIIRTLMEGQLQGTIEWMPREGGGTVASLRIPLAELPGDDRS